MKKAFTLGELSEKLNLELVGDANILINDIKSLDVAKDGDISFIRNHYYLKRLKASEASAYVIVADFKDWIKNGLISKNPRITASDIVNLFFPAKKVDHFISKDAFISPSASLSKLCTVYPQVYIDKGAVIKDKAILHAGVYIGENSIIEEGCELKPGVIIYPNCKIGKNVLIHSNSVIGTDGWGFEVDSSGFAHKIPHKKGVIIRDEVEIGANCSVDAGSFKITILGEHTKMADNSHVGHNSVVGKHCFIGVLAGIGGSSMIGDFVTLKPKAAVKDSVTVGDHSVIEFGSSVMESFVPPGSDLMGHPVAENKYDFLKQRAAILKTPYILRNFKKIEEELASLKKELTILKSENKDKSN